MNGKPQLLGGVDELARWEDENAGISSPRAATSSDSATSTAPHRKSHDTLPNHKGRRNKEWAWRVVRGKLLSGRGLRAGIPETFRTGNISAAGTDML